MFTLLDTPGLVSIKRTDTRESIKKLMCKNEGPGYGGKEEGSSEENPKMSKL
jgi:hypothetical protein